MVDDRVYYSGRIKDMIIVRGQNFYAQVGPRLPASLSLCLSVGLLWTPGD